MQIVLVLLAIFMAAAYGPAFAAPSIKITTLSPYGSASGKVEGVVSGVNFSDYYLAAYIQADEVWWTKPCLDAPRCAINPATGAFSCEISTGGCDRYATAVALQLLPAGRGPIICFPCQTKPDNPGAVAAAYQDRPYPHLLTFSGYQWRVKKSPDCPLGDGQHTGPNYFSDAEGSVSVDRQGLHLRIRKDPALPDRWYCSEVILQKSLGYGTYIFQTRGRLDQLDPNVIFGIFTWDGQAYPAHRELDIEFVRWGDANNPTNAQFVVQPCPQCPGSNNCSRFSVELTGSNSPVTTFMKWEPGSVEFRIYRGRYWNDPPETALIQQWINTGADVPVPGKENIRFNLWLYKGLTPASGEEAEVLVENFVFRPRCALPEE